MPRYTWSHADKAHLITMLASGKLVREVAAELGRPPQAVYSYLHAMGTTRGKIRDAAEKARASVREEAEALRLSVSAEDLADFLPKDE